MRLWDGGKAPNPRRVRIFLAEKGLSIDTVPVDMGAMEHRSERVVQLNPLKQLPVLELDDGMVLTETMAICRYLEALHPEPSLMGRTPFEIGVIEMWNRRIEFNLYLSIAAAFRHIHPAMKEWEVPQVPEWGEVNKPKALAFMTYLDSELANREFIAGSSYSVADITAMVALDFTKPARIAIPDDLAHLNRWLADVRARPSAHA